MPDMGENYEISSEFMISSDIEHLNSLSNFHKLCIMSSRSIKMCNPVTCKYFMPNRIASFNSILVIKPPTHLLHPTKRVVSLYYIIFA